MKTKKRWGRKGFALFLALLLALSPAAAFAESPDAVEDSKQPQAVEETKAPEPETKAEESQKPETKPEVTETKVPEKETEKPAEETKPAAEPSAKEPQEVPASNEAPEKEPVKEQTENHNEKEQVPQVVKTFLNAVQRLADLGTMTEENAEQFTALGQAAMDAYEAVQDAGLEHYEGVQKALAALMRITDSATGGTETMALIRGEQFIVNVIKVVNGQAVDKAVLTPRCLQSTGHSGYNHSTNLQVLANESGFSGYKGYNWSNYTTVPSSYTKGLCPNNNYASVHYNITGSAPYKANETLFLFFESSKTFTLEYDANNGLGAPETQTATGTTDSHRFTISKIAPIRDGYEFLGWSTSKTATSPSYYGGGYINVEGTTTLYAVWKEKAQQVTLTYDGNGNTGGTAPAAVTVNKGTDVTVRDKNTLEKDGYTFRGWDTDKNAESARWSPGDEMRLMSNVLLYAIWEENTAQPSDPTTTLAVTKVANVKTVKAGDTVVYTITVTNTGETAAKNVTVTDVLDSNLNWMRAELNGTGITPVSGVYHIGELAVGMSATLTITAQVAANVEPGTEIVNTATADNDNKPEGRKPPGDTAKVTVTAPEDPQQIKLTFVVVNGSWNDGTKETIVKPVELGENGNYTIKSDDVPKVGDKPDEGYKAGSWDDVPNGVTVTADTTYTYTYVKDEDATNPTDPTDPGDSTDPTAPTDPSDSTDPTNPSDPTDSTKPTNPGESTEPTTPTTPPAPTQPTDPVSPTEPTTPSQPTNPTIPSVPSQPTDPTGPTVPTDPTTPVDPTDPTEPSDPAGPTEPTEPTEPTTPVIPAGPTTPVDPGSPSGPDTPNTPAAPNGPAGPVGRTTAVDTVPTATPAAIPAVAALAPAAAAAVGLPDDTVPLAGQEDPELAELDDEGVPLAKGASGAWALLNFALMNLAIFECLMLLIGYFIKTKGASEEEEEEKKKLKKKGVMRIISLPIAVVSIVAFCLTEDITLPTAFVDRYTLLMAIIALVQTVAVVLSRKELKDETDDETEVKAAA